MCQESRHATSMGQRGKDRVEWIRFGSEPVQGLEAWLPVVYTEAQMVLFPGDKKCLFLRFCTAFLQQRLWL